MGGFAIDGETAPDRSGASVNAAGDVDGDGLADLIIGSPGIMIMAPQPTGKTHVIFGSAAAQFSETSVDHLGGSSDDTFTDGGIAKTLVGGAGNDSLTATAASVLYGGAGDDLFVIGPAMIEALQSRMGSRGNVHQLARIDGGSGIDTLALGGSDLVLDLNQVANPAGVAPNGGSRIDGIEIIDLTGTGNNTLWLSATEVLDLVGFNAFEETGRRQLMVKGDQGDEVELVDSGWEEINRATMDGVDLSNYTVWEHDASLATLYLAPNVAFNQLITIVFPPLELA
jgi:Ca2+-binding RTX toxin-like protein